jgi:two-component system response regulator AtoC/two-component system nitrogen regulation response regulator NtrX
MKILIVDDEETARYGMRKILGSSGEILEASDLASARQLWAEERPDIVLLDLNLGGEDGFDLLEEIQSSSLPSLVLIITAHGNERVAVEAMKKGAYDYLSKPFEIDDLRLAVRNAVEQVTLRQENERLREQLAVATGFGDIVGRSAPMREVFGMVEKVSGTDVTVLLTGESGVGKELVALELHRNSPRAEKELVTVNCAAIPENLIESELFGHEKGAFTGATQTRIGKFEKARGGTLFLDEIGDMPLDTQAKILRVLEEKKIQKLGSNQTIEVDVRIISATNRDLSQMVEEKEFREDLFYRLEVIKITIPPLRERKEDIPLLTEYFLDQFSKRYQKSPITMDPGVMSLLMRYSFPGNVRQLRNLIERLVVLANESVVVESELPGEIRFFDPTVGVDSGDSSLEPLLSLEYKPARESFDRKYLLAKLGEYNNNITHTAEAIGIHRQSLQQKIKDLDLKRFLN